MANCRCLVPPFLHQFMFQYSEARQLPGLGWAYSLASQHLALTSSLPAEGTLTHYPVSDPGGDITVVTTHHHHHGQLLPVLPQGVPPHLQAGA